MSEPIPALTLWQPWASLIAAGHKTIETRGWETKYRGPLAIHAASTTKGIKMWAGPFGAARYGHGQGPTGTRYALLGAGRPDGPLALPLGCVVAVCELVDVVPIVDRWPRVHRHGSGVMFRDRRLFGGNKDGLWLVSSDGDRGFVDGYVEDQLPFGDFSDGRWAWLLDNVRPVDPPQPAVGHQRLWRWTDPTQLPTALAHGG